MFHIDTNNSTYGDGTMKSYWDLKITDNGPSYECPKCGMNTIGEIGHQCTDYCEECGEPISEHDDGQCPKKVRED